MIDVTPVLLSYQTTLDQLLRLATGSYLPHDNKRKWFYKLLGDIDDIESLLQDTWRKFWTLEDIAQEVYLTWHQVILKYYGPNRTDRSKRSLQALLFSRGALHLITHIRRQLIELNCRYPIVDVFVPWEEGVFTDFTPGSLLRETHSSVVRELRPRVGLSLYKTIYEGKRLPADDAAHINHLLR